MTDFPVRIQGTRARIGWKLLRRKRGEAGGKEVERHEMMLTFARGK